jgi:methionyl-tRNA formyltransferase
VPSACVRASVFKAVVFAYSEVGVRCLAALVEHGVQVPLVFTHEDCVTENAWFGSVAKLAAEHGIAVVKPGDANSPQWVRQVAALAPDYIFSFYYRSLLAEPLLACPRWGALNMHGSLLPKYRGRACVNWAILNGESQTGATLHYMVGKPDAGPIVAQEPVAIGIDDTALVVSQAVAKAAARLLVRWLPTLAAGPPAGRAMNLSKGSYFGGRTPEDGRIDWSWPAARIHALIRAVAPPFPGAFTDLGSQRLLFAHSNWCAEKSVYPELAPCLYVEDGRLYLDCSDGVRLKIAAFSVATEPVDAHAFGRLFGEAPLRFSTTASKRKLHI